MCHISVCATASVVCTLQGLGSVTIQKSIYVSFHLINCRYLNHLSRQLVVNLINQSTECRLTLFFNRNSTILYNFRRVEHEKIYHYFSFDSIGYMKILFLVKYWSTAQAQKSDGHWLTWNASIKEMCLTLLPTFNTTMLTLILLIIVKSMYRHTNTLWGCLQFQWKLKHE